MKNSNDNSKPLKSVIQKYLKSFGYDEKLDELNIKEIWKNEIGKTLLNITNDIHYKDGVLTVKLQSSTAKNYYKNHLEELKQFINQKLNKVVVKQIIIL